MHNTTVLVLGSSSWLGSILIPKLFQSFDVIGTFYKTQLNYNNNIKNIKCCTYKEYKDVFDNNNYDVIINFLRGENEVGYQIHKAIIKHCQKNKNTHYLYCSSALALDGYNFEDLTETKLAKAKSDYGVFKANCERMLYDSGVNWSILRFSSLQGYCKHKIVRNEYLLSQLKKRKTVYVDQEVFQNRLFAEDAVNMMVKLIELKKTGIFHLGTVDASDEIDFLRKQAEGFGYPVDLIQPKNNKRNINLNCIPSKIFTIIEKAKYYTEEDTLLKVFKIEALQSYKNSYGA